MDETPTPAATPPKQTLYCPQCWHAAAPTGDWLVRPTTAGDAVVCPECGRVVTVRPTPNPVTA